MQGAYMAGLNMIRAATAESATHWIVKMKASATEASKELHGTGAAELNTTKTVIQAEKAREAEVVQGMLRDIEASRHVPMPDVMKKVGVWARSRSQNQVANATQSVLQVAFSEGNRAEELRQKALGMARSAAAAAKEMAAAGAAVDQVAQQLSGTNAAALVESTKEKDEAALVRLQHALQLVDMAGGTAHLANILARTLLSRAVVAEADAGQALERARTNTRRIERLKLRMQSVLQHLHGQ